MIQIEILNGTKAGTRWLARRFPFGIGREKQAAISLSDDGVWESHLELVLRPGEGCFLRARPESMSLRNGHPVSGDVRLANGDLLEAGSVRMRFSLAPAAPSAMAWRETAVWLALASLCLGQVALIYLVLP